MNIRSRTLPAITGLAVMLGLAWSGAALSGDNTDPLYQVSDYLPVQAEGYRYTSTPYGEMLGILNVAEQIKTHGSFQRSSTRGMNIPDKSGNRTVDRYDYTFPATCGGSSFSYYEGNKFTALAYVHDGSVILDVMKGGSPYTAPRLWGPYDQVLNDDTPMVTVVSFNGENGTGLMSASFLAGEVTGMGKTKQGILGNAYSSAIYTASRCGRTPDSGNLVVNK